MVRVPGKPLFLGYDALERPVRLTPDQRKTHMHVIGSSGSGKSKFLEWMIRGDVRNRQGFCLLDPHGTLYEDVLNYCAHRVAKREIILLDLSQPNSVIGFNPFERTPDGDVSVQVDHRIIATMHAWGVENADETPTLARVLRVVYTVMIEQGLTLPQAKHLIDFERKEIRRRLIQRLENPLIRQELSELTDLTRKEWRDEVLSTKNRLFRFLDSKTLCRFMGLPERNLNLAEIMDQGKILLVNLKRSDHLSAENARVFGSLLINEFFEAAFRRQKDARGRDPNPYYLYLDEFQNFVSLDIADMLDQVRKFGLFMVLSHQRFGQLTESVLEAALSHCRLKAVFGGLTYKNAEAMARELFVGKIDPKKVKAAIHQTKFWPEYRRDKVYSKSSTQASSYGTGHSTGSGMVSGTTSGSFFDAGDWFSMGSLAGTSSVASSGFSQMSGSSSMDVSSYADTEGEADIPIFFPVPFQELSSLQFYSPEEQLLELTAALMRQFQRHCFIQIHQQEAQPMLVPFVPERRPRSERNRKWYRDKLLAEKQALPATEVDSLIESREVALLKEVNAASGPVIDVTPVKSVAVPAGGKRATDKKPKKATPWEKLKDPIGRE